MGRRILNTEAGGAVRVIAGTARRTLLVAPVGAHTRPTSDRAKEALFSILGDEVRGARWLDLFCGSGAVGIEALSRGAARVVFVENARAARAALRKNLAAAAVADETIAARAEVMDMDAHHAVELLHVNVDVPGRIACGNPIPPEPPFDIVFMDPPYGGGGAAGMLAHLGHCPVFHEGARIIAETDKHFALRDMPFTLEAQRDYGRTRFWFYRT